ncbi:beta-lactamase [Aquitalea magnusonii]|nr:beta-lactamase [Aquitalea magnusonii]
MHVKVLGSSSGNDQAARTTCFKVDDNCLLDCGSGISELDTAAMLQIDTVLLTHNHLDHCCGLPLLADAHITHGGRGVDVYTQQETISALKQQMFNSTDWPDYTRAAPGNVPWLRLHPVEVGDAVTLPDGIATALPAEHSVPALGWLLEGPWRALAFTGDSGPCLAFWHWISHVPSLTDVICELSYLNEKSANALAAGHMSPALLVPMLEILPPNVHVWLTHTDHAQRAQLLEQVRKELPSLLHLHPLDQSISIEL